MISACPFCGGQVVDICRTNKNACWVQCGVCGAQAASDKSREGALRKWNRRDDRGYLAEIRDDDDADFFETNQKRRKP